MKKLFCHLFVLLLAAPPLLAHHHHTVLGRPWQPVLLRMTLVVPEGLNSLEEIEDIKELGELRQEVEAIWRFKRDLKNYLEKSRENFESFAIIPRKRRGQYKLGDHISAASYNRVSKLVDIETYEYLVDIEIDADDGREVFKGCEFGLYVSGDGGRRMHLRECSSDNTFDRISIKHFLWLWYPGATPMLIPMSTPMLHPSQL